MTVQDDEREKELCRLFNLEWDASHPRAGTDAHFVVKVGGKHYRIDTEVKSSTGETVSTARDVGLEHIKKWRQKFWVFGFYRQKPRGLELQHSLCLTPTDMEPWVAALEEKVRPDFELAKRASRHLTLDDLHAICGKKTAYTVIDAKRLHKSQWSLRQYLDARDTTVGRQRLISATGMLEILKLRAQYIAERGATLNNPHITKTHFAKFASAQVRKDWAVTIRRLAEEYVKTTSKHPFPEVRS